MADEISLKKAANNAIQAKQQGELQPEFQVMMERFRGEQLQMQNAQKRRLLRDYF